MLEVDLVEFGGNGGVFQHTVAVAQLLAEDGARVVLHTSDTHEHVEDPHFEFCTCVAWSFAKRWGSGRLARRARPIAIGLRYILQTIPHLLRVTEPGRVVHFQGLLPGMSNLSMRALRRGRRWIVHSPHNTFSRGGIDAGARGFERCTKLADRTIVFSSADIPVIEGWGARREPILSPLVQYVPPVSEAAVSERRARWRAGSDAQVVLFAGQVRRDKRLDLVIRAAEGWPPERRLAVVGDDIGPWREYQALAASLGVPLEAEIGFVELPEFMASIAAADVIVCPYDRASQSGVLAVAAALGTPTVATDVGGLTELAGVSVPPDDVPALRRAIDRQLAEPQPGHGEDLDARALSAHLRAYARS